MLKLNKVTLSNFCQLTRFTHTFEANITSIVGPNGCGKTTIFRGIIYALTAWCDPAWGTPQSLQKDDEPIPGYAEIEFTCDGESYTLHRPLVNQGKHIDTITKNGEVVVSRRQACNEWLEERLGVPLNILATLVWIRQEESSWLLTATPAVISAYLSKLFDVSKLEKLREVLKKEVDTVANLRSDFGERKLEAEKLLKSIENEKDISLCIAHCQTELETVSKHLQDLLETKLPTKAAIEAEIKAINERSMPYWQSMQKAEEVPEAPEVEGCLNELIPEHDKLSRQLQTVDKQLNDYEVNIRLQKQKLNEVDLKLGALQRANTSDTCHLCGSKVPFREEFIRNQVYELTGENVSLEEAKELYAKKVSDESTKLSTYREQEQKLKERREYVAKCLDDVTTKWKAVEKWNSYKVAKDIIKTCNEAIATFDKQIYELKQRPVMPDDVSTKISQLKVEKAKLERDIAGYNNMLVYNKTQRSIAEQTIQQCQKEEKEYRRNNMVITLLTTVRSILSTNRAQARYLKGKAVMLNRLIATFLELTDMPFTMRLSEEGNFVYKMNDSLQEHPAAMLSGAQKAVASVALQMALITTAEPQIGLLLADEIDASLSEENKHMAVSLLRKLSTAIAGTEGSVLVISQSDVILADCENTILRT